MPLPGPHAATSWQPRPVARLHPRDHRCARREPEASSPRKAANRSAVLRSTVPHLAHVVPRPNAGPPSRQHPPAQRGRTRIAESASSSRAIRALDHRLPPLLPVERQLERPLLRPYAIRANSPVAAFPMVIPCPWPVSAEAPCRDAVGLVGVDPDALPALGLVGLVFVHRTRTTAPVPLEGQDVVWRWVEEPSIVAEDTAQPPKSSMASSSARIISRRVVWSARPSRGSPRS